MAAFVDGETTVGEAREGDFEEAIERVTGLSLGTIRAKLRDANGNTKLRNLFKQWPERIDEIGSWTANSRFRARWFRRSRLLPPWAHA